MRKSNVVAILFVLVLSIPASAISGIMPVPEIAVNWGNGPGWQGSATAQTFTFNTPVDPIANETIFGDSWAGYAFPEETQNIN